MTNSEEHMKLLSRSIETMRERMVYMKKLQNAEGQMKHMYLKRLRELEGIQEEIDSELKKF